MHNAECQLNETGLLTDECPGCAEKQLCDVSEKFFEGVLGITQEQFAQLTDPSRNPAAPLAAARYVLRHANAMAIQRELGHTRREYPGWAGK